MRQSSQTANGWWLGREARRLARRVTTAGALLLVATHPGAAAPAGGEAPTFGEVVDVQLVAVEAVVSDAAGHTVTDLGPADFALFEDGARVPLEHVELVGAAASSTAPVAGAPDAAAAAPPTPIHLAIFLDEVHVGAASRLRILRQMADVLSKTLRPSDSVMLAVYDGGTRVVLPFTADRKALAAALTTAEPVSAARLESETDWRWTMDQLKEDAEGHHGVSPCSNIAAFVESYSLEQYQQVSRALDAFGHFVDSLAGIVGRKAVLHVSDGIPMRAGAEAAEYAQELCVGSGANEGQPKAVEAARNDVYDAPHRTLESNKYDTTGRWEDVAARANAGNVSIYTFQAGPSAELATIEYPQARPTGGIEVSHRANLQESLFVLADRSGGRAWLDGADLGTDLAATVGELQSYYLLTYTPPASAAAGVRRVRLEVARPGVTVRYRKLYRPRTPHQQVADGLLGRLLYSTAKEPSPLQLELTSRTPAADSKVKARFRLHVPLATLTLPEHGGLQQGAFTVFMAVADPDGATSPVRQARVPVRLAPAGVADPTQFIWEVEMLLRSGDHDVAVAVQDESSGETSFVVRRFDVAAR